MAKYSNALVMKLLTIIDSYLKPKLLRTLVQLKFNFTLARKDTCAFTSFLHGITEYFSSN